jgi:predicted O-methyltransferase YrrM
VVTSDVRNGVVAQLQLELYGGDSPLSFADERLIDDGYPHTNLRPELVRNVLRTFRPKFWLEFGSMLGGSAIRTADVIKELGAPTEIVCVDPFTGDVNMWDWERSLAQSGQWRFLRLERGRPTIYDRFLANVVAAGHADIILPIAATSTVGAKLLRRLHHQGRLSALPDVIYLDSAHEPNETYQELWMSWNLLAPGGVLMGDDWSWEAVRTDVLRFAQTIATSVDGRSRLAEGQRHAITGDGVLLLDDGHWVLTK